MQPPPQSAPTNAYRLQPVGLHRTVRNLLGDISETAAVLLVSSILPGASSERQTPFPLASRHPQQDTVAAGDPAPQAAIRSAQRTARDRTARSSGFWRSAAAG